MNCTYKAIRPASRGLSDHTVVLVTNNDNGLELIMPTWGSGHDDFERIRFHVKQGDHLQVAYSKEPDMWRIYPEEQYVSCIKDIYLARVYNAQRQLVERPVGDWIYDEACKCLAEETTAGRIDIGDGFIVPSPEEQVRIVDYVTQGTGLLLALKYVDPALVPPLSAISYIEEGLRTTNWRWADIYRAARADWIASQSVNGTTTPGVSPTPKKNNTLLYVAGGIVIFLILISRSSR